MMLAFLVDQTQELCCPLFQAVHKKLVSRRSLWDHVRSRFQKWHCRCESMQGLLGEIHSLYDLATGDANSIRDLRDHVNDPLS